MDARQNQPPRTGAHRAAPLSRSYILPGRYARLPGIPESRPRRQRLTGPGRGIAAGPMPGRAHADRSARPAISFRSKTMSDWTSKIVFSQLATSKWAQKPQRAFLEYRDLGASGATGGRVSATVARAVQAYEPGGGTPRHIH